MAAITKKRRGVEAVVQNSVITGRNGLVGRENADDRVKINRALGKKTPAGPAWKVAALNQPSNSRNSGKEQPAKKSLGQTIRGVMTKAASPKKKGR